MEMDVLLKFYIAGGLLFLVFLLYLYPRSESFQVFLKKAPLLTIILCIAGIVVWPAVLVIVFIVFLTVLFRKERA